MSFITSLDNFHEDEFGILKSSKFVPLPPQILIEEVVTSKLIAMHPSRHTVVYYSRPSNSHVILT
jgi:hypothetical protein